ncbi:MAG: cytochrome c oxidase subunit II [Nitrospiraceae bacterium]|nr:cytochrome c oxidase subunit II [Nitrospiraceae bacterium]
MMLPVWLSKTAWPSNTADSVQSAFLIVTAVCCVLLLGVTATMIAFLIKYNSRRNPVPGPDRENLSLEIVWTVVPVAIVLGMFYVGWVNFDYIRDAPADTMNISVLGRQWQWSFTYANGRQSGKLRVPLGKPVKLEMTSADVIHSFYIPAFKVKEDVVPGMKTHLWFIADRPGAYDIFCTEYCGLGHSRMRAKLIVMPVAEFNGWYRQKAEPPPNRGLALLQAKGCLGCHNVTSQVKVGPGFKGIYGSRVTVLVKGREQVMTVDEAYLKFMITNPDVWVVKGFPPIMPKIPLTEEETGEIIQYIKTLK